MRREKLARWIPAERIILRVFLAVLLYGWAVHLGLGDFLGVLVP